MKLFTSYKEVKSFNAKGSSVCIGNFDGMHLGHQQLFNAVNDSKNFKLFLSFRPHPKKILNNLGEGLSFSG